MQDDVEIDIELSNSCDHDCKVHDDVAIDIELSNSRDHECPSIRGCRFWVPGNEMIIASILISRSRCA